ncbi:MAG: hypothetical protein ACI93T_002325 [Porticoccaceae bacterium]|jgi:hypothetical protein
MKSVDSDQRIPTGKFRGFPAKENHSIETFRLETQRPVFKVGIQIRTPDGKVDVVCLF